MSNIDEEAITEKRELEKEILKIFQSRIAMDIEKEAKGNNTIQAAQAKQILLFTIEIADMVLTRYFGEQ